MPYPTTTQPLTYISFLDASLTIVLIRLRQSVHLINDKYGVFVPLEEALYLFLRVQRDDLFLYGVIVRSGKQHCRLNIFNGFFNTLPTIRYVYDPFILSSQITDEGS